MTAPRVIGCDVWAYDTISLEFSLYMVNNSLLKSTSNYSIVGADSSIVNIKQVRTGSNRLTYIIWLIVDTFSIGQTYMLTCNTSLLSSAGVALNSSFNTAEFIGRRTKIDSAVTNRPSALDMTTNSVWRTLFSAIHREDDIIGGNRIDRFVRSGGGIGGVGNLIGDLGGNSGLDV